MAKKLYATIAVYDDDGLVYRAKNTRLSTVLGEMGHILSAKVDDRIKITAEGVE